MNGNTNTGNISSNGTNVGGVFGQVYFTQPTSFGTYEVKISKNKNDGSVKGEEKTGGIMGSLEGYSYRYDGGYYIKAKVSDYSNSGSVSSTSTSKRSIVGYLGDYASML